MPRVTDNRDLYESTYTHEMVAIDAPSAWDRRLVALRQGYLAAHGRGRDVLDLCCGTGEYLAPVVHEVNTAVALDFSPNMLAGLVARWPQGLPANLMVLEGDATAIPLRARSVDFVSGYSSLYQVPGIGRCLREISRVLRPGGAAALELGNVISLNTLVTEVFHRQAGWGKLHAVPLWMLERLLREAGLTVERVHRFQVLPMYGAPRRLLPLWPLLSVRWKTVMGVTVKDRTLDEWISGSWPLRYVAFRHFYLLRKP